MPTSQPSIYKLKVLLLGVSPVILRRLLVCGDSTITDLHYWFHVDRFDRKQANRRRYDYACGKNVFAWAQAQGGGQ